MDNSKWLERKKALREMIPTYPILSSAQARDAKTIEWALTKLNDGNNLDDIRAMAGLFHVEREYIWRVLKKQIYAFMNPSDETSALTDYMLKQSERIDELENEIRDLDARISKGPNDRVAYGKDGVAFAVEDTRFYDLLQMRIDARKMLLDEANRQFKNYIDHKKSKNSLGKYQGAVIHIHSNVPRPPDKIVQELESDD